MIVNNNNRKIKQLAEFMALQYDEEITPLEKIIFDEQLRVYYDCYEDAFDGMTIYYNGKFSIHLNTDKGNYSNSERGRFTLAHELGHYFIDAHRIGLKKGLLEPNPSETDKKQHTAIERKADYFAACLLMPEVRFCKDIARKKFSIDIINLLKDNYKVSFTACVLRFKDIGNHPIMIVYAENNQIKWKFCSDGFRYKWLLNDNIVPQDTVMGEYFTKNNTENTRKTEIVFAEDWFKCGKDDTIQEKFYEYCFPHPHKKKAVSVIWED